MTTWGRIRDRLVERLNEYTSGAAENKDNAAYSPNTLYSRITDSYREMVHEISRHDPMKVATVSSTFSYTANAESITLPTALQYRPVFSVDRYVSSLAGYVTIPRTEKWVQQRMEDVPGSTEDEYRHRIEAALLYVFPIPSEALTLRARYLAVIADITPSMELQSPTLIPVEFHSLLSLNAAASFLREGGSNANLERELERGWDKFARWASKSPKTGPRFVHEV